MKEGECSQSERNMNYADLIDVFNRDPYAVYRLGTFQIRSSYSMVVG